MKDPRDITFEEFCKKFHDFEPTQLQKEMFEVIGKGQKLLVLQPRQSSRVQWLKTMRMLYENSHGDAHLIEHRPYRRYRRGKNRCAWCGYKLDDANVFDTEHTHYMEKMWSRIWAKEVTSNQSFLAAMMGNKTKQRGSVIKFTLRT